MLWNLVPTVIKGVVDVVKTKTETKKLMAKAEQTHIKKMAEGEIAYAIESQKNMQNSWRDEWFTVILSIPLLIVLVLYFLVNMSG